MSFEKITAMKKIVEGLDGDESVETPKSNLAASSSLVTNKEGTYCLLVDYLGLKKQILKTLGT